MTEAAQDRAAALRLLGRASRAELADAWNRLEARPDFETLRPPEIGLVMARGRAGGTGFNLGEVTVTRAAARLVGGDLGIGYVLGRDGERALLVARFDALWQSTGHRGFVEAEILRPVARRTAREDALVRQKAAATKVDFFTLARGED